MLITLIYLLCYERFVFERKYVQNSLQVYHSCFRLCSRNICSFQPDDVIQLRKPVNYTTENNYGWNNRKFFCIINVRLLKSKKRSYKQGNLRKTQ